MLVVHLPIYHLFIVIFEDFHFALNAACVKNKLGMYCMYENNIHVRECILYAPPPRHLTSVYRATYYYMPSQATIRLCSSIFLMGAGIYCTIQVMNNNFRLKGLSQDGLGLTKQIKEISPSPRNMYMLMNKKGFMYTGT